MCNSSSFFCGFKVASLESRTSGCWWTVASPVVVGTSDELAVPWHWTAEFVGFGFHSLLEPTVGDKTYNLIHTHEHAIKLEKELRKLNIFPLFGLAKDLWVQTRKIYYTDLFWGILSISTITPKCPCTIMKENMSGISPEVSLYCQILVFTVWKGKQGTVPRTHIIKVS